MTVSTDSVTFPQQYGSVTAVRFGKVVFVYGAMTFPTYGGSIKDVTLPVGYRPAVTVRGVGGISITVTPDGIVSGSTTTAGATTCNVTYMVA